MKFFLLVFCFIELYMKFTTAYQDHQVEGSVFPKNTTEWRGWVSNQDHVDHNHGALTTRPRCQQTITLLLKLGKKHFNNFESSLCHFSQYFFSKALRRLTHSLPDKTFISIAQKSSDGLFFAVLKSTVLKFLMVLGTAVLLTFICLNISRTETFIVQRPVNWMRFSTPTAFFLPIFRV